MNKLIFFDIDGTLANGLDVPASAASAIKETRAKGNKVMICTGRAISYVKKYFHSYADGFIAFNGRYGEIDDQVIYNHPLSEAEWNPIKEALREEKAGFVFFNLEHGYYEGNDAGYDLMARLWDPGFIVRSMPEHLTGYSCDILFHDEKHFDRIAARLKESCLFNRHGAHPSADTTFFGIDKGTALQSIAKSLGVPLEDTYAFGDGSNDIVMMRDSGHGIAMGNGVKEVKEAAEYITTDINDHGVRNGLKHYELI